MADATHTDDAAQAQRLQLLESLGQTLSTKRGEAIAHRASSGIETIWLEDEEHYMGIDDANRASEAGDTVEKPSTRGINAKPATSDAPVKSNVFPNITQPYVDAGSARVCDMLLPTDDRNFAIESTPIPELADFEEIVDAGAPNAPALQPAPNAPALQPAPNAPPALLPSGPGTPPPGAQNATQGGAPLAPPETIRLPNGEVVTREVLAAKIAKTKATAKRKADLAQTQIDDWLTECDYLGELRQTIDDSAKVGTGVLKGPVPAKKQRKLWRKNKDGQLELVIVEVIAPTTKNISYWNLYPDPACGEDIHRGSWIWEVDTLSEKSVKALKGVPGYIDSQLAMVLEEGPTKYTAAGKFPYDGKNGTKGQYQIWYFHGTVSREDIEAAGCECPEGADSSFEALITMINDHVVRAALNPLDSGEFPYDVMRWKRRRGFWAGVGIARQMRTAQRMVTAATRNLMDNAGLGAGPMFVFGRGIVPQDGTWEIRPRKIFVRSDTDDENHHAVGSDVETIIIPMLQAELTSIIQLGMKMAEDSTGLPMLLQGQQGTAPDTVGGMQILNNNGSSVLRRIARLFDNGITIPHINRYYDWLMMYGEDDECKGDMFVKARGSSALVERDSQTMELAQIVGMTTNPIFGKDPKKAMNEYLKSRRFDPTAFDYTKEEQAQLDAKPPMPPPAVMAAQIRAKTELEKTDKMVEVTKERIAADTDRDREYVQAETDRTLVEQQGQREELSIRRELAMLDYANKHQMKIDDVKAALAKTAMTIRAQRELAGMEHAHAAAQVATPAAEPPGRAPNGEAFQS